MTASEYVLKYHHLWTPEFKEKSGSGLQGSGGLLTPVLQYLNRKYTNAAGKTPKERLDYKDHLLGFFKQRAKESDSGITYSKGDGYSLSNSTYPVSEFAKANFMSCFCGKGSPEMLFDMIQLISYWRAHKVHKEGKTGVPYVVEIVDKYLGADCNGFVGNYLVAKYAGVKVGPSTKEKDFRYLATYRKSPAELRPDDVLVFDGFHHVSIIDKVLTFDAKEAQCMIAESRSKDYGGPQFNVFTITCTGPGAFSMRGEKLDSIVKARGTT